MGESKQSASKTRIVGNKFYQKNNGENGKYFNWGEEGGLYRGSERDER